LFSEKTDKEIMTNSKLTPNKLSIIVPAYNEGKTIHLIFDKIKNVTLLNEIHKEIIVVNDCSTDNTGECIKKYIEDNSDLEVKYFEYKINMGKGAASDNSGCGFGIRPKRI
jgi:glycosyltransferase involved in cell wall biosynthesis